MAHADQVSPFAFHAAADLCVIGSNPESADMTNPRGDVFGFCSYVVAEDPQGNRRLSSTVEVSGSEEAALEPARKLAAALQARHDALGKLPVGFAAWRQGRPAYGSNAYVAYGQAEDLELERREALEA